MDRNRTITVLKRVRTKWIAKRHLLAPTRRCFLAGRARRLFHPRCRPFDERLLILEMIIGVELRQWRINGG